MKTPRALMLALICCVLVAVFGATLLTVRIEQQAIDQTRQAHVEYMLGNLRTSIEASLTLGLTLEQNASLQRLVEREKSGLATIHDISIHGPMGQVLYSTDLGLRGAAMPAAWAHPDQDSQRIWCVDAAQARSCGVGLRDELGRDVGGLVLVAPHEAQAYSLQAWLARGVPTLALAALAVLVAFLGTLALVRHRLQPFQRARQMLRESAPGGPARDPLVEAARQSGQRHRACQQGLDQQLRQLKDLEHGED